MATIPVYGNIAINEDVSVYDTNDTMLMIGRVALGDNVKFSYIQDVIDARMPNASPRLRRLMFEYGVDVLALGFICGKRADRARRAKRRP